MNYSNAINNTINTDGTVVLGDGGLLPLSYFDSEEILLDRLLDRAIKRNNIKKMLDIRNEIRIHEVIFSGPATIVLWSDGTKTIVKCTEGDKMDYEVGIAMCTLKKLLGESYPYFKKHARKLAEEKKDEELKKKLHGYVKELKKVIDENKDSEEENDQET